MEKPTVINVYAAIDALYHTQQTDGKEAASKWLDKFQKSVCVHVLLFYLFLSKA